MAFMPTRGGRGPSTPIVFVPVLNDLVLSGALVSGVASNGIILNATNGSLITSSISGLTVNSASRTYSYNGSGSAGSVQGLTETLAGATFSPRNNFVTIVSASVPAFTSNPSISPSNGDQSTTFAAIDGAMSNGGTVSARRWLLNGTSIGSGTTIVQGAPGSLVLENTGTGNVKATSTVITVAATGNPPSGGPYRYFGVAAGQSNNVARGQFSSAIDTEQANITQFPAISRSSTYQKTRASVFPLYHVEDRTGENFLGPTNWAAKIVAGTIGANDQVQILPYSWGATSLVSTEANGAPNPPQWGVGRSLQQGMIDHLKAAIANARAEGFTPVVKWVEFFQGEADNRTVSPTDFKAARIAQINDIIAQVPEAANAVFILPGYLPEKLATLATLQALEDANKQLAAEMPGRVKYVRGPSGYMLNDGLEVHYNAAGTRVHGRLIGAAAAGITLPSRVTFTEDRTIVEGTGGTGVTNVSIPVRRDTYVGAATAPVTLTLGTAIASDFPNDTVPTNLEATFADGSDVGYVNFGIKADAISEQNKTFSLALTAPSGYELGFKPTMTIVLQDDDSSGTQTWFNASFTAPDATAASSYITDTGETVTGAAGFVINNGELYSTGSGTQLGQVEWTPPADGLFEIEADLHVLSITGGQAIRWAIQDGNNFYWCALPVSGTSNVGAYKQKGGSPAQLGTSKQPTGGLVAGNTYRMIIRNEGGGKRKVTINGEAIISSVIDGVTVDYVVDTEYVTGKVGWRQSGAMAATTGIHITNVKARALTE